MPCADAGRLGDLHDRRVVVAELGEDVLGRLEQPPPGRARRACDSAARRRRSERRRRSRGPPPARARSSSFCTLFIADRGSSSTNRTAFGTLKRASRAAAVLDQLVLGRRRSGREDDEREADLAPALVRHADDGRVGDRRMLVQHGLDLGRVDVLAAGDEHVLEPAADPVEALVVALGDVAGAQPAVRRTRPRSPPGCASSRGRRSGRARAARPRGSLRSSPSGSRSATSTYGYGLPGVAELAHGVLRRQAEHVRRRLGQAVALDDRDAAARHVSSSASGIGAPPTTASRRLERSALANPAACAMKR